MKFYLTIAVGIAAISMASILIKMCAAPAMAIATYRLVLASSFFLLAFGIKRQNPLVSFKEGDLMVAVVSGVFLCIHFITWITSLKYTSVTSSVVLVATAPVFVGLGSMVILREPLTKWLIIGIILTISGAAIIGGDNVSSHSSAARSDSAIALPRAAPETSAWNKRAGEGGQSPAP